MSHSKEIYPVWTGTEVQKFEDHWPVGTRQRLVFAMGLYAGLRRYEVPNLGPENFSDGYLLVREVGHTRAIPVLSPLKAVLDATPVGRAKIVIDDRSRPMTAIAMAILFRKACDEAGVPGRYAGLRRTFATSLVEGGATEAELQAMMGWSPQMVMKFFHRQQ